MAKEIKRGGAGERKSENGSNPYFNLDAEKAFFDEVDEEVRNEKFKELVNKYGGFILAVVIAGLAFAVGYEKVGEWRVSKAEQRSTAQSPQGGELAKGGGGQSDKAAASGHVVAEHGQLPHGEMCATQRA